MKHIMEHVILRVTAAVLGPPIFLFALYVQFHGDYGPGGGFQAGVIFATSALLYGLVLGIATVRKIFPMRSLHFAMAAGTLIYGGVGVMCMIFGGAFLDYAPLAETARAGRHLGIFLVEVGVGVTVASTMIVIFRSFTGRQYR